MKLNSSEYIFLQLLLLLLLLLSYSSSFYSSHLQIRNFSGES
jgi:hypothetical protein